MFCLLLGDSGGAVGLRLSLVGVFGRPLTASLSLGNAVTSVGFFVPDLLAFTLTAGAKTRSNEDDLAGWEVLATFLAVVLLSEVLIPFEVAVGGIFSSLSLLRLVAIGTSWSECSKGWDRGTHSLFWSLSRSGP
jgi:hypothetical protein